MCSDRIQWLAASLLLAAACGWGAAEAASFDCRRATLAAEKAISGNANLSSLDDRAVGAYFTIIGSDVPAATRARVKQAQSRFIARRNACGADIDCLVDAYTDQMMFLRNEKSNL